MGYCRTREIQNYVRMVEVRGRIEKDLLILGGYSTSSYYRGAHGIIIVYDITKKKSFDGIKKWMKEIGVFADPDACKLLVGNKTDLADSREISAEEGQVRYI